MKIEDIKIGSLVKIEGFRGSWEVQDINPQLGVDEVAVSRNVANQLTGQIEEETLVVSIEEIL
jgi:hypothetical protein